jgi:hypothetical protein
MNQLAPFSACAAAVAIASSVLSLDLPFKRPSGRQTAVGQDLCHRPLIFAPGANAAKDEAARKAELKNAKAILADYIQYVKSEPLIAHIDTNPWVKVDLKKTLVDTITHMAQSIGS